MMASKQFVYKYIYLHQGGIPLFIIVLCVVIKLSMHLIFPSEFKFSWLYVFFEIIEYSYKLLNSLSEVEATTYFVATGKSTQL